MGWDRYIRRARPVASRWLRYAFSGSSFGRVERCPASAALPGADAQTAYATDGTDVHAFVEQIGAGVARDAALANTAPAVREACARIDVDALPRGRTEVALAYDHATGLARVTRWRERRYEPGPTEIPMTLDVLMDYDPEDDSVAVVDYKFVRFQHDAEDDRPQLEIQALAAAAEAGASRAHCVVGMIQDDGAIVWRRWTLDTAALDAVAARVVRAARAVAAARADRDAHERVYLAPWRPDVRMGAWCRYCPARASCPGKAAVIAQATGAAPSPPVTLGEAGAAYTRVRDAELWAASAREAIKEFARQGAPLPTGDGREVVLQSNGAFKLRRAREV